MLKLCTFDLNFRTKIVNVPFAAKIYSFHHPIHLNKWIYVYFMSTIIINLYKMKKNFFFMKYEICQISKLPFVTFVSSNYWWLTRLWILWWWIFLEVRYIGYFTYTKYHKSSRYTYNPISKKSDQNNWLILW